MPRHEAQRAEAASPATPHYSQPGQIVIPAEPPQLATGSAQVSSGASGP